MAETKEKETYRFLYSYKERRKQYKNYVKYYDKLAKNYGPGMTHKLSYMDYKTYRTEDIRDAKRLGSAPPSNKAMARKQVRRLGAAKVRRKHVIESIQDAIDRESQGKTLSEAQKIYLEKGTYWGHTTDNEGNIVPIRRIKSVTKKDIINESGVQQEIYEALKRDDKIEDISDFYGYID